MKDTIISIILCLGSVTTIASEGVVGKIQLRGSDFIKMGGEYKSCTIFIPPLKVIEFLQPARLNEWFQSSEGLSIYPSPSFSVGLPCGYVNFPTEDIFNGEILFSEKKVPCGTYDDCDETVKLPPIKELFLKIDGFAQSFLLANLAWP